MAAERRRAGAQVSPHIDRLTVSLYALGRNCYPSHAQKLCHHLRRNLVGDQRHLGDAKRSSIGKKLKDAATVVVEGDHTQLWLQEGGGPTVCGQYRVAAMTAPPIGTRVYLAELHPTLSSFEVTPPLVGKQAGSRGKLPVSRLTMPPDRRTISCDHPQEVPEGDQTRSACPRPLTRAFF
jgi:hypothetical protein